MSIKKDSTQTINALFSFLNSLESVVLWICAADYSKSIFMSQAYDRIWARSRDFLLENGLASFREAIVIDDAQRNADDFMLRCDVPDVSSLIYRIHRPDGELRYIKDTSHTLLDREGKPSIMVGIAESILPERWDELYKSPKIEIPKQSLLTDCLDILRCEYKLIPESSATKQKSVNFNQPRAIPYEGVMVKITAREHACLYYLSQGNSTKETARLMNISPRTVEQYLVNLRDKFGCRTKLSLLGKLQNLEF